MKHLTNYYDPKLKSEGKYGYIPYEQWVDLEIKRLNDDVPEYAYKHTRKDGHICIKVREGKIKGDSYAPTE